MATDHADVSAEALAPQDKVIRAVTQDGAFRVIALRTTDLVREAIAAQGLKGAEARTFGELMTGAVLVRETMAPDLRVQVILSDANDVSMVADAHPAAGLTRGLMSRPQGRGAMALGEGGVIKVIRTLPRGQLHQSVVAADSAGVSGALMSYLQTSSQIVATVVVTTVMSGDRVVASGGYIVQLLPECEQGPLMVMTERLVDFAFLDDFLVEHDACAEKLLYELLYAFPCERLAESPLAWGCYCSEERALSAIATMGREQLADVIAKGEVVDLTCEYCGKVWGVSPSQLENLLTPQ